MAIYHSDRKQQEECIIKVATFNCSIYLRAAINVNHQN